MKSIRWGILGLGRIARQFAIGLRSVPDAELVAVGSRTLDTAMSFAAEFKVARAHASYEALAADPGVDVVYVATPHPLHHDNTKLCLKAGKAVLCEKPFTINAREAEELVETARRGNVFLMEAMWTRFLPVMAQVREWLDQKLIGEPRMVMADFGYRAGWDPASRALDPHLGGGALLDVGIYPISFASMVFGAVPCKVTGLSHLGATGVDEQTVATLAYGGGELALLACAVRTHTAQEARILGTAGSIHIPEFWHGSTVTLSVQGQTPETRSLPLAGNGYNYEAVEVGRCLRAGLKESPVMPLAETVAIMRIMDELRRQWGLVYPQERSG